MQTEGLTPPDESKWIIEKFTELDIPRLFYSAEFGRIRRLLRDLTFSEELDIEILGFDRFIARLEIWNQVGIPLLKNFNRPIEAEDLYREMLETLLELESRTERQYHKGTPNHNLGVALLIQNRRDDAKKYFLQALRDDIKLCEEKNLKLEGFPAYKIYVKTYGETPPDTIESIDELLEDQK